ncbi:universal stress protein [Hyphomicrobium sp.]|uniref:universal stress protein n=1 Tax=Hyphomicrobium sp. TaxID=82 RepID=UPI0025C4A75F|nr:universal stress protein [Hyphomicrobium sp.]MCC7252511.1 universal stress protein [Hyphomicrobium sp.]
MRKLLVPFDNSENAVRALEYVLRLAKEKGPLDVTVVHVHEPPIDYGRVAAYLPADKIEELQRQHSEELLKPAAEMAKAVGVPVTCKILIGDVANSIVECAESAGCDGILMGTRGMSAIGNLVMGSVATKVIHLTKLPVTLIK